MPVGIRAKFSGGTQEQYDAIHSHMNVDADPPEGVDPPLRGSDRGGLGCPGLLGVS
jgi:hypothetical protein